MKPEYDETSRRVGGAPRVLALLLLAATEATAQTRLTFDGAMRRALEVNNTVESSRAGIGVASASRDLLLSAVMPRISIGGDLTRNSIESSFGGEGDEVTLIPRNDWRYQITLSQPIFAGRRELRAYSQAKLGVENARQGSFGTEDGALLRVASSFLALVNAEARMEIELRNIELAQRRRTQASAFYEAGEVTRVDVLRAETAVKAAQRVMAGAEQARQIAESDLRAALDLEGPLEAEPPAQKLPPLPDEATLVARAAESRPDVNVAENNMRIAELEISKQRGYWLPTVTFDGGLISQKSPFPAERYSYGALRFNIPIFQSGEVVARVAGAKQLREQARLSLQDARIMAREDVLKALVDLRGAEVSLALAGEQLQAAEAEYAQSFELYRAQEATSLDVASSETSLADARRAVAEETLNRDLAELRVWYAAGAIKEALLGATR
ncbi:MAG TPA: TolC family protein [Thermoanaerobaculia bacterium]|nr:TolC family protein [Thermoanaerobaculia bacterium]